jgi:hypothetical protein
MGAARGLCVRAVFIAAISALVSSALPACQFPGYYVTKGGTGGDGSAGQGGDAGANVAGSSTSPGGVPADGGEGGGDAAGAGGERMQPPTPCAVQDCVPRAPAGWLGPVAFWQGKAVAADKRPGCPQGYGQAIDVHRDLNAPDGTCQCTCAAQGQVCDGNTTLEIFDDLSCANRCATVSPHACDAVSGCTGSQGSLRAGPATPTGGSCRATLSAPPAATWLVDARLCGSVGAVCEEEGQVCAPTPSAPFFSELCVMRVLADGSDLPECPDAYPIRRGAFYDEDGFTDDRGCTACGCSGVTGGSCSGTLSISTGSDCSSDASYTLDSGCKTFNLGSGNVRPSHVGGHYTLVPGACSVASASHATGSAAPSGSVTLVCCP